MNNLIIFVVILLSNFICFILGSAIEGHRIKQEFEGVLFKAYHDGWDAGWDNGFSAGVEQEKQRSL